MKIIHHLVIVFVLLMLAGTSFAQRPTTLWRTFYDGPTSSVDNFVDMVVDVDGNAYVLCGTKGFISGYDVDITTYKLNTAGQILWSRTFTGPGTHSLDVPIDIVYDPNGAVITMARLRDSGMIVVKYDLNGNQQWAYQPSVAADVANSMEVDNSGNIYIAGTTRIPLTSNYNALFTKISPGGTQIFRNTPKYGGTASIWYSEITKIINDGLGSLVVVGNCKRSNGNYNSTFTAKYSPGGGEAWSYVNLSDTVLVGSYTPADITVDGAANVYSASYNSQSDNTYNNALVIKQNAANGNVDWISSVDAGNGGWDRVKSIRTDGNGYIYLSTYSRYFGANASHVVTKMGSISGDTLWRKEIRAFGMTNNGISTFNDMIVEDNGDFYIATPHLIYDVIKYNTDGDTIWNKTVEGGFTGTIGGYSWMDKYLATIIKGPGGKIYVGCSGISSNINSDTINVLAAVLTEETSGFISGSKVNLGLSIDDNQTTSDTIEIITDNPAATISDVNITIDTVLHANDGDLEFYLIHGGVTDTIIYQTGGSGDNYISTTLDDGASSNISTGSAPFTGIYKPYSSLDKFNGMNASGNWILQVYDRATGNTGTLNAWSISIGFGGSVGIQQTGNTIPEGFSLSQNYPNPFNPETKIKFDLPANITGNTKLAVYDITGREVMILTNQQLSPGTYEYSFDAAGLSSGVYFYSLKVGEYSQTKKMLLVK